MNLRVNRWLSWALLMIAVAAYGVRIKDSTLVAGGRDNQLIGYGLVVGLAGNGDSQQLYTTQTLTNALLSFGVNINPLPGQTATQIKSNNVAAVMITADVGPFIKEGTRLDVTVSSIGDAKTLQGGILLQTPLYGADGQVYAVAQGAVVIGGFYAGSSGVAAGAGGGGSTVQKNHPTVGTITGGAIVERSIGGEIIAKDSLDLFLLNPDFTSAVRIAQAINNIFAGSAQAKDLSCVNVRVPEEFKGQEMNFIARIGAIETIPDTIAKVIINERTGVVVATEKVRLSTVAVSHGSLVISITNDENVSQPGPFSSGGTTTKTNATNTEVNESRGGFKVVDDYPTIERLTAALNAMGVSTREMMSILQAIKAAGALQADLVVI